MTNKEILEKAIQRAIDGGWYVKGGKVTEMHLIPNGGRGIWSQIYTWQRETDSSLGTGTHIVGGLYDFIFNHDFAKALWGELTFNMECRVCHFIHELYDEHQFGLEIDQPWKFHLQQMVIADDPIKYLGENI